MLDLRRLEARERRLAALHEAGHAVLAREIGMLGVSAEIWRARDPSPERNSWVGQMHFLDSLGKKAPFKRSMIGVAGLVAVNLFLKRRAAASFSGIESLSPTDLAIAGVGRDAEGGLDAGDVRHLMRACQAVALVFRDPDIRRLLLRTARRLILEAGGRYDGPLFHPPFAPPKPLTREIDALAADAFAPVSA